MTKKNILESLKEIKEKVFVLCMQKNTITRDEFEDMTDRIYKKICRLKDEIDESVEKRGKFLII